MKDTIKRLTAGATRLLVLALGLGLVSTAWAALTATEVWEADQIKNKYDSISFAKRRNRPSC